MAFTNPTVADFKAAFPRAFVFNADPTMGVTDTDIAAAYLQVNGTINPGLFTDQAFYNTAYLNLAAHFLTLFLRAAGGAGGGSLFLEQSRSVGSVSQSFAIPQSIANNALWAAYMSTPWGAAYLTAMLPYLSGQIFSVRGMTHA